MVSAERYANGRRSRSPRLIRGTRTHPGGCSSLNSAVTATTTPTPAGYAALRHFDESPQLPTGYPGMILMALVPPLFIAVMDSRLDGMTTAAPSLETASAAAHA